MPRHYKKRSYKSARPGYVSCGKMVFSDAQKALAMAKYVKGLVNVEFKNHDVQGTSVAIGTVPVITQLTNIAQGDTTNTRDGASIKVTSFLFKYKILMSASAFNTQVRVMLILDRQTNEAIYLSDDLLQDITVHDSIVSARNLNNAHRFKVLYDRVHVYNISSKSNDYTEKYIKLNIKLRYDNAAAAITSLTQQSLSLLTVGNESSNQPNITSLIRIRYVDN